MAGLLLGGRPEKGRASMRGPTVTFESHTGDRFRGGAQERACFPMPTAREKVERILSGVPKFALKRGHRGGAIAHKMARSAGASRSRVKSGAEKAKRSRRSGSTGARAPV